MRNIARLLVLALMVSPAYSPAQKKTDLELIQRDIADLEESVKKLQKSQDDKMQALTALVQQSMESSTKVSASLSALQSTLSTSVSQTLADQQTKNASQHADMNARLDTLTNNFGAVSTTMEEIAKRQRDMDSKLKDLLELVKTMNAPPALPAPVATQNSASGAPAGWVPSVAYNTARNDLGSGRFDLAIQGFADYVKFAPKDDENAPNAQYYIGMSYYSLKQYDSAAQAFADVVEKYSANPKTCESRYMKARALHEGKNKSEALSAYNEFLMACPADTNRANAREYMNQLSGPARGNNKSKGKGK